MCGMAIGLKVIPFNTIKKTLALITGLVDGTICGKRMEF